MSKGLEGIKVVEVGGAAAMPLAGMLMSTWGADVIHVEPPTKGDQQRWLVGQGMSGWSRPHSINYLWEHVDRNKKSIVVNMAAADGQAILHKLIAGADVFLNNLRPYELDKFNLTYEKLSGMNPRLIFANLTGYGARGPEKNSGGYDSVAFWARSGVMDLMHDLDTAPNISRPAYGDSVSSLCFLSGIMAALYIRERSGVGQKVEVSLFNTATYVLGYDITGCLMSGEDAVRPQRKSMANPIRNVYPTKDKRWIMLGMTNAQHYWPGFCKAIERPDLENDARFATMESRRQNSPELVAMIENIFRTRTYEEWISILEANKLVWSPVKTPLEVTKDEQATANDFFVDYDHPKHGRIRLVNNPIKLSKTPAQHRAPAPELGEHTAPLLRELGYSDADIERMKKEGTVQ
ncbi:MAG TPA: CoA transferase [Thermodesulfobacteriota bacterium]|nr:CoA transferase [Thermodesulfobacteriota bacterium]